MALTLAPAIPHHLCLSELHSFFTIHLLHDHGLERYKLPLRQHSQYFFQLYIVCITCLEPNQGCLTKTCVSLCVQAVSKPEQGVSGSGTPTCPWDNGERGAAGNRWHCGWEQGHTLPTGLTSGQGLSSSTCLKGQWQKGTFLRVKLLISSLKVSLTSLSLGFLIFQARQNLF